MQNDTLVEVVMQRLRELGVAPFGPAEVAQSLAENIESMMLDAHCRYAAGEDIAVVSSVLLDEHLATGALHAEHLQHPAGPMLAAEVIFDEYLPSFVEEVGATASSQILAAARALHAAVWSRFPAGAVAYTEALRQRVTAAHLDSRVRIARDLHDRIAHGVLAGLHRIELLTLADPGEPQRAEHLMEAAHFLRTTLRDMQGLAVTLHARVEDDELDEALELHARQVFGNDAALTITSNGTRRPLANWRAEEALTILLEALTNWRKHAPYSAARVAFAWRDTELAVDIVDDGPGFDDSDGIDGRLGLRTMRERAALIGARFAVKSSRGQGTSVHLELPYGAH